MIDLVSQQLVVFHGELNPQEAYVYVRFEAGEQFSSLRLAGHITGPRSRLTRTLPATVALRDLGPGPHQLARAIVPDPCFWAPGAPYLYDVQVDLLQGRTVVAQSQHTIGLRRCGVQGSQLRLESQPWQIWGASGVSLDEAACWQWREAQLAMFLADPVDSVCEEASQEGVVIVAVSKAATAAGVEREVRRLSRHASVPIIALGTDPHAGDQLRQLAPNTLLAQCVPDDSAWQPAEWADLLIRDTADTPSDASEWSQIELPQLLRCRTTPSTTLLEAADRCRQLTQQFGTSAGFAGCLV